MRKIEVTMRSMVICRRNWSMANTQVIYDEAENVSRVYLHGNHIANCWHDYSGIKAEPNRQTFADWPTVTTASRLRALGIGASTAKGGWLSEDDCYMRRAA